MKVSQEYRRVARLTITIDTNIIYQAQNEAIGCLLKDGGLALKFRILISRTTKEKDVMEKFT
jgi:hypothetical protein